MRMDVSDAGLFHPEREGVRLDANDQRLVEIQEGRRVAADGPEKREDRGERMEDGKPKALEPHNGIVPVDIFGNPQKRGGFRMDDPVPAGFEGVNPHRDSGFLQRPQFPDDKRLVHLRELGTDDGDFFLRGNGERDRGNGKIHDNLPARVKSLAFRRFKRSFAD